MESRREAGEARAYPTDTDIDAVLLEADGDAREAIRMLLSDLDALARDHNASVSHGYVYGRLALVRGGDR